MALGTFIAGAYTVTYNAVALGIMTDGFTVELEPKEAVINRSDQYGDMLIDSIYRGADWFESYEAMEYKAGPIAAYYPFGTPGVVGVIGRLGSDLAQALIHTSTTGTPAVATPATLTATKAKLAPNSQPRFGLNSLLRTIPTRLVWMPYDSGAGVIKHWTST